MHSSNESSRIFLHFLWCATFCSVATIDILTARKMLKASTQAVGFRHAVKVTSNVPVRPTQRMLVRASADTQTQTKEEEPKTLTFQPNAQASSGYVEYDTAGQSNMYPVMTKAYEAGSSQDSGSMNSANTTYAIGAAVVAIGVLAIGLIALTQSGGDATSTEQYLTLTQYAAKFATEL
eukprot:jgi/Chrzof1/13888/Cz08g16060.t1